MIDGTTLTITGGPDPSQLVKADVINGGAVSVTGATDLLLGALKLGENAGAPSNGSLTLSASGIRLSGFVTEGASALGSVRITPAGSVTVPEFNALSIQSRFDNDGAMTTEVLSELAPSPGSPASDGTFTATAAGTFSFRPGPGSTFTLSDASEVTGAGAVELSPLLAEAGTVHVADGATFTPGSLGVFGAERLNLDADAQVAKLQVLGSGASGGRRGDGLLIVTGPPRRYCPAAPSARARPGLTARCCSRWDRTRRGSSAARWRARTAPPRSARPASS